MPIRREYICDGVLPETANTAASESAMFRDITEEMAKTFEKKNSDYGNSFFDDLDDDGLVSSKIMLRHKFSRFSNLIKEGHIQKVENESLEDTLLDMANYAILTVMWLRKKNKLL